MSYALCQTAQRRVGCIYKWLSYSIPALFHALLTFPYPQPTMSSPSTGQGPDPPLTREKSTISYSYDNLTGWKSVRVLRIGRGMYHDVRRRLPYYWSDIRDAWTYRTVASIVRMYFVK